MLPGSQIDALEALEALGAIALLFSSLFFFFLKMKNIYNKGQGPQGPEGRHVSKSRRDDRSIWSRSPLLLPGSQIDALEALEALSWTFVT